MVYILARYTAGQYGWVAALRSYMWLHLVLFLLLTPSLYYGLLLVFSPTPGTDARWRAAVREAVYALRGRGLAQYVREAKVVNWTGPPH